MCGKGSAIVQTASKAGGVAKGAEWREGEEPPHNAYLMRF